ncbi:MAG: hypothetical protein R6X02_12630, partial [Enhygromyxa sp.]
MVLHCRSRPAARVQRRPWLVLQEDLDIALVVEIDGERLGRIPELASYGVDGAEIRGWKIRSSRPVDAWLHMNEADAHDRHIVLTELAKRELLRTDVTMNMREASPERELDAPRVEIAGGMVEVSACGGRLR